MSASLHRAAADRGSIPMALLVIIALSAVIGALVATVIGSTRQARFDQQYTEVVQAADAGAQAGAAILIRSIDPDTLFDHPTGTTLCGPTTAAACPATGTSDAIPYEWTATKVGPLTWEVRGTAVTPEATRTVVLEVADYSRFFLAAFSDRGFEMAGGNGADSYGESAWYTGNGIVASNEYISLSGSSTEVDAVHLYNWDNNSDLNRCTHTGGNDCDEVRTLPDATPPSARFGPKLEVGGERLQVDFIDEALAACEAASGPAIDYVTSIHGSTLGNGTYQQYCVESFTVDTPTLTVNGEVDVYVSGNISFGISSVSPQVNCQGGCAVGTSAPDARNLSFYVDGIDATGNVTTIAFKNQSDIVAGIYAPESECEGNPSNAQVDMFGSLICGTISNQGGWNFHYDDRLGTEGAGNYTVRGWREEIAP